MVFRFFFLCIFCRWLFLACSASCKYTNVPVWKTPLPHRDICSVSTLFFLLYHLFCAAFCASEVPQELLIWICKIHYIIFLRCFLRIRSSAETSNMNPIGFIISYSSPLQHWSLTKHITIAQLFWPFILDLSYFFWTWNCPHIGLLYFIVLLWG